MDFLFVNAFISSFQNRLQKKYTIIHCVPKSWKFSDNIYLVYLRPAICCKINVWRGGVLASNGKVHKLIVVNEFPCFFGTTYTRLSIDILTIDNRHS